MDVLDLLNDFQIELICQYKDEVYSVRDNGSVMRHVKDNKKPRKCDNEWTFGKYNEKTGYAEIAGERVHRIVAKAFHGDPPSSQYVVDHIDTNRRNNRPENLRWVTRLENILLNPITAKKILSICGSIEAFLENPSILNQVKIDRDFEWMRAVNKEEAANSLNRFLSWAKSDCSFNGRTIGEWIFTRGKHKKSISPLVSNVEIKREEISVVQKKKPVRILKSNPFNFDREKVEDLSGCVKIYKTGKELIDLIKDILATEKKIKFPKVEVRTAGKGILICDDYLDELENIEYRSEKLSSSTPFILCDNEKKIVIFFARGRVVYEKELELFKNLKFHIVEIDLSWTTNGVVRKEMEYILQVDATKKKWIYHNLIEEAEEKLKEISEPVDGSGHGVFHSYIACPHAKESIEDLECYYCDYRLYNGSQCFEECFGKVGIKSYKELLSIVNVKKEEGKIIGITFNNNGKMIDKKFDKDVNLLGKTIFELWDEKDDDVLLVHNLFSDWYVLIEENPRICYKENDCVYGRLSKSLADLESSPKRSIYSFDSSCWEIIRQSKK